MPETKKENKKNIEAQAEEPLKNGSKDKKRSLDKNSDSQKNGILFYVLTIITALLLVALIIGGTLFFAVKKNVNGIADSMGDSIDKIPVLRMALPTKIDIEDEKNLTEKQVRQKYTQIKAERVLLDKQVSDLTKQADEINKQLSAKDTNSALLQQQKVALENEKLKLTADNVSSKKNFDEISAVIAAGDATEYKKYFEKIDPKVAADLYAQILKDQKMSDDVKKYCSIYENMDASAVSSIMEQLGASKMTLIVEIMKNLKKETSGAILTAMTPAFAAKLSEQLAKVYNVGTVKVTK
ncbi:MAG TPA: hypothetical protein VIK78_03790 [Ruminiclostridium sp.]